MRPVPGRRTGGGLAFGLRVVAALALAFAAMTAAAYVTLSAVDRAAIVAGAPEAAS